jgi:hypothetical protein
MSSPASHFAPARSGLELTDKDILMRLTNTEDSTVERKTANDYRDCLKTAVAFSNSLPVDDPGIIFVGVRDDGAVEGGNLDSLQRKVSSELSKVYPPIYPQMKIMKDKGDKEFLAVIVRGSAERPHFAGPSYVRDGMQTREASEQQFGQLIAERDSKVREILKWKGRQITLRYPAREYSISGTTHRRPGTAKSTHVVDCNHFFATLQVMDSENHSELAAYPLSKLEVSFDPQGAGRLSLILAGF